MKKLKETGITFKVDGKTMIFAHGLEFKLDKICLTFKWKEEQRVLDFFSEEGEFSESYPGFKYYDKIFWYENKVYALRRISRVRY